MPDTTKMQNNLKKLADLKAENPFSTHIYMRRPDGVSVDIPMDHADFTIRQNMDWDVEDAGVADAAAVLNKPTYATTALPAPAKPNAGTDEVEEKPEAHARLSREKLEELAKAEGCTDEEIAEAEDKKALADLVNSKRAAGTDEVEEDETPAA